MTPQEAEQLQALIAAAFNDTGNLREHAERIVEWHYLRPLARGDLAAARRLARQALQEALEREKARLTMGELVALLRRTDVTDYIYDEARVVA